MFKVVTDQLKVSQGWVRCGQCADVFDASQHLLPYDPVESTSPAGLDDSTTRLVEDTDPTPLAGSADVPGQDSPVKNPDSQPASPTVNEPSADDPAAPDWSFPRWVAGKLTSAGAPRQGMSEAQDSAADFDPAGWKDALRKRQRLEDGAASAFASITYGGTGIHPDPDFSGVAEDPPRRPDLVRKVTIADAEFEEEFDALLQPQIEEQRTVSFVREAERKAFWTQPWVRGGLAVTAFLLTVTLIFQGVMQQKDSLAAWEPRWAPMLARLCDAVGCRVQPPRRVESLVIDSSTFNKLAADSYRLSFVLKNTGNLALEMPAIEVTLTDTQDQPLIRRIVLPAQFGVQSPVLGARAEIFGAVSMKVSSDTIRPSSPAVSASPPLRVAGYRILAFYP